MKKINNVLSTVIVVLSFIYLIRYLKIGNYVKVIVCSISFILMLLPIVIKKYINQNIRFIYILYIFFMLVVGSIMNLYNTFYYYDGIMHFSFGVAGSLMGLFILDKFKYNNNMLFNIIIMILTTLALAAFWEIFEFISDKIFKGDTQNVLTTGVNDTMKDIILAFLSSILFSIYYKYNKKKIDKLLK